MVFIAPKLTAEQALVIISCLLLAARGNRKRFLRTMHFLIASHCFRLRDPPPRINTSNHFDPSMDDATARTRFNFTLPQLRLLATKMHLPKPVIITPERDAVPTVEALAMLCRRLKEPSMLYTVANEFGRSPGAYTRVCRHLADTLYNKYKALLYFNHGIVAARIERYCEAIRAKGSPLARCWGFVDGTKEYVSRPSARRNPTSPYENLQRSLYNGHPRRHCFNWQAVTAPDGIIVSIFGPVEGRRHDSTMLSMSGILDVFKNDESMLFNGKVIYGDPAYGCSQYVCCPFENPGSNGAMKLFNSRMSSVREAVEWGFGRVKMLWSFLNWDKKLRTRQTAVGKLFVVGVLLSNLHACLQPTGNQISIYFNLLPPSVDSYLNAN